MHARRRIPEPPKDEATGHLPPADPVPDPADHGGLARAYWQEALYEHSTTLLKDIGSRSIKEGDPREPLKFKAFLGASRRSLPPPALSLPLPDPPVAAPPDGLNRPHALDAAGALDDRQLSALLYYTYGVHRHDLQASGWPYHRMVPSARCFFPTELHLALPEAPGCAGGVHYYDPMHHGLVRVRGGDHLALVGRALGADLDGCLAVALVSSVLWKSAFRYRDYAYRLCTQEAGLVAGNLLLVARALGLEAHAHFLFQDDLLHKLCALSAPQENTLLVLPLYPGQRRRRLRLPAGAPLPELPPVQHLQLETSSYDAEGLPVLTGIARASFMAGPPAGDERLSHQPPALPYGGPPITVPASDHRSEEQSEECDRVDLAAVLRQRDSGPGFMDFEATPAAREVVWRIAREVATPYPTDIVAPGAGPPVDCYLWLRSVAGFAPGVYRLRPDGSALDPLGGGRGPLPAGVAGPFAVNVNAAQAAVTVLLAVPREAGLQRFGARSFRILSQAAGIVAQRISVAAARGGLSARIHNGYDAAQLEAQLGIRDSGSALVFRILIGHSRPGSELRLPVVF